MTISFTFDFQKRDGKTQNKKNNNNKKTETLLTTIFKSHRKNTNPVTEHKFLIDLPENSTNQ